MKWLTFLIYNVLLRILSEYLGLQTMLAVVCKSYEGVKNLETYTKDGLINKGSGIHEFAASKGRHLDDRFHVICLENLRYVLVRLMSMS